MGKKVLYEGPDISYHNGCVNIKKVRDEGYKRVGIRAGYGRGNVDQKYGMNALACYMRGCDVVLVFLCIFPGYGGSGGRLCHRAGCQVLEKVSNRV